MLPYETSNLSCEKAVLCNHFFNYELVGDAIRNGDIQIILPQWRAKALNISLLYPSAEHLSAKVRAFVDTAVEHFAGIPEWDRDLPL